ncbi:MAG: cation:proton antiporter [Terriglobales bacterium]
MIGHIAIEVLLAIAVITAVLCCVAIAIMPDFYERLHYMASVTTVSAFGILIAVVIQEGWGQATIKTILVCMVLLLINAILTHATARAARVRTLGHWSVDPDLDVSDTRGVGGRQRQKERKRHE